MTDETSLRSLGHSLLNRRTTLLAALVAISTLASGCATSTGPERTSGRDQTRSVASDRESSIASRNRPLDGYSPTFSASFTFTGDSPDGVEVGPSHYAIPSGHHIFLANLIDGTTLDTGLSLEEGDTLLGGPGHIAIANDSSGIRLLSLEGDAFQDRGTITATSFDVRVSVGEGQVLVWDQRTYYAHLYDVDNAQPVYDLADVRDWSHSGDGWVFLSYDYAAARQKLVGVDDQGNPNWRVDLPAGHDYYQLDCERVDEADYCAAYGGIADSPQRVDVAKVGDSSMWSAVLPEAREPKGGIWQTEAYAVDGHPYLRIYQLVPAERDVESKQFEFDAIRGVPTAHMVMSDGTRALALERFDSSTSNLIGWYRCDRKSGSMSFYSVEGHVMWRSSVGSACYFDWSNGDVLLSVTPESAKWISLKDGSLLKSQPYILKSTANTRVVAADLSVLILQSVENPSGNTPSWKYWVTKLRE